MDNYAIADQLSLLAKLMDIHGENSFKAKSYASAAFAIEKLPDELAGLAPEKIFRIRGIGESVGKKIIELLQEGGIAQLQEYISRTPEGVLQMMNIKGLGPKKIHTIWKEMGIDTIKALEQACLDHRLAAQKGFGDKTEAKILEAIRFQQSNAGRYLYAQVESFAEAFEQKMGELFPDETTALTGAFRRQLEVIELLEYVTTAPPEELKRKLAKENFVLVSETEQGITFSAQETLLVHFYPAPIATFGSRLFETSCSDDFLSAWKKEAAHPDSVNTEAEVFRSAGLPFIPPFLREKAEVIRRAKERGLPEVIQTGDIRGLVHSHSSWSDGAYTIEQMARELIALGFEYLVISDHSKAAFYANGLSEERILAQHREIDALNKKLAPFRIFKSIECDILPDGSLDYSDEVLRSFDLVITSIHSNLDMEEEKAMMRLMGAIRNPHTTILGHMTGRLLLRRKGYPVDHKAVIDACAEQGVAIEINAHPSRLDMDWRWIEYALEKGVYLSVDPDAHTLEEFAHIKHGVLVAQKGGLTKDRNLSSFTLKEFESFLSERRKKKGIS